MNDYAKSVSFYRQLGLKQIVDSPENQYARFETAGGATLSIQCDPEEKIAATQVIARVREALGVELSLRLLFEAPTLSAFAAAVAQHEVEADQLLAALDAGHQRAVEHHALEAGVGSRLIARAQHGFQTRADVRSLEHRQFVTVDGHHVGLVVAALVGWRLRFRPSEQARTWQRGARGERRTAHLLDRLTREGFVVFHDLAVPGSRANVDHLAIGPTGLFVIDSKQWTGSVHQSADGPVWHNHYPLDRALETVGWEAQQVSRVLGSRAAALLCVHGAHVQGGGLHAQGVAIVPAYLLRSALGQDRVLSDADVDVLATTARLRLRPATSRTNP